MSDLKLAPEGKDIQTTQTPTIVSLYKGVKYVLVEYEVIHFLFFASYGRFRWRWGDSDLMMSPVIQAFSDSIW